MKADPEIALNMRRLGANAVKLLLAALFLAVLGWLTGNYYFAIPALMGALASLINLLRWHNRRSYLHRKARQHR